MIAGSFHTAGQGGVPRRQERPTVRDGQDSASGPRFVLLRRGQDATTAHAA